MATTENRNFFAFILRLCFYANNQECCNIKKDPELFFTQVLSLQKSKHVLLLSLNTKSTYIVTNHNLSLGE